jgi:hypothetical protein
MPRLRYAAKTILIGSALAVAVPFAGGAQAQGLFEFLFGSGQPQPQPQYQPRPEPQQAYEPPRQYYGGAPRRALDVTVRPRSSIRKTARKQAPSPPVNVAINPTERPNWYLEDPTLRKGDIVVLPGRVLVFQGGRGPIDEADYVSLDESRYVSKAERQTIKAMAGLTTMPARTTSGAKVTALDSAEAPSE